MRPSEYKVINWYRFCLFYTSNTSEVKLQTMKSPLTLKGACKCNYCLCLHRSLNSWHPICSTSLVYLLGLLGLFYPISSTKVWLTSYLFHIIGSSFGSNLMHCVLLCLFCENTIHWMLRCYFWRFKMVIFNFARLDRKILHPSRGSWISSEYLY